MQTEKDWGRDLSWYQYFNMVISIIFQLLLALFALYLLADMLLPLRLEFLADLRYIAIFIGVMAVLGMLLMNEKTEPAHEERGVLSWLHLLLGVSAGAVVAAAIRYELGGGWIIYAGSAVSGLLTMGLLLSLDRKDSPPTIKGVEANPLIDKSGPGPSPGQDYQSGPEYR